MTTHEAPPDAPVPEQLDTKTKERLEQLREKLEQYQKAIMGRFSEYVLGMALLPPASAEKADKAPVLILIDDSESKKMPKNELRDKLHAIFVKEAAGIDEHIEPETLLLSELWGYCYDGKYEVLQTIAQAVSLHDVGMLSAIKLAEIHKQMVLKKFEKYIVCYVLAGSLVQGTATTKSDVDVFIVIDDTDVKKMTRAELKDKLRAIIIDMGFQAGDMTGINNKINIQVYILTDFWDNIKEANPVIFTFLRDGVPFFDRGVFMPWKQLLEMGKVKPSQEAIDIFMSSGDQMLKRVSYKLKEVGMEDFYWATITPSQAALMLYGLPPPTPKETANVLREVFVKKEGLLEDEYVDMFQKILKVRKDLEHGTKADISGKELDELADMAEKYLKRLNKLFEEINTRKEEEAVLHTYENTLTIVRDALRVSSGVEDAPEERLHSLFEKHLVHKGNVPEKYSRFLKDILAAKKDYDRKKLTKTDIAETTKKGREFFKVLIEHIQRSRTRELERCRIRVKHGEAFGEVLFLHDRVFIVHDLQKQDGFSKAKLEGHQLAKIEPATLDEYEAALANPALPEQLVLKEKLFEQLKEIFGKDVEVLL